ncbi:hypothetical protein C8R45DRAFT_1165804 [Mycena sanguinolenta]|nr:hypothetical protein C8R45DRAFT_1165804 [Mycena sanguinolenta]
MYRSSSCFRLPAVVFLHHSDSDSGDGGRKACTRGDEGAGADGERRGVLLGARERNERQQPWGGGKGAQKRRTAASSDATPQTTRRRNKEKGRDERKQGRNEGKWRGNSHADSSSSSPSIPASRGWYWRGSAAASREKKARAALPKRHIKSEGKGRMQRKGGQGKQGQGQGQGKRKKDTYAELRLGASQLARLRRHIEPKAPSAAGDVSPAHGRRGWAAECDGERLCEMLTEGSVSQESVTPSHDERFCSFDGAGGCFSTTTATAFLAPMRMPGKQPPDGADDEDGEQRQRQAERREALGEGEGGRSGVEGVPMDWEDEHRASEQRALQNDDVGAVPCDIHPARQDTGRRRVQSAGKATQKWKRERKGGGT